MCHSPCHVVDFRFFFLGEKIQGDNQLAHLRLVDCKDGKETSGSLHPTLKNADNAPVGIRTKRVSI